YREELLAEWDKLDWRNRLALLWHSAGAFMDALWLQPKRLEDEGFQDLRFGVRMLFKSRVFTAVAVLSLALGIGAKTIGFRLIESLCWSSPSVVNARDQLVGICKLEIPRGKPDPSDIC